MAEVLILRNFLEDQRTSMEVYADNLLMELASDCDRYNVSAYRPKVRSLGLSEQNLWVMRYARYIDYPLQVKKLKADIFHISEHGYAQLIGHVPPQRTVVTVHDLIPLLRHRGCIPGVLPGRRPWLAEYSLKNLARAAHIISISENTKKDLIHFCQCDEQKISVIHPGVSDFIGYDVNQQKARQILGLPEQSTKLILICGQDFYKNLQTSVTVFEKLCKRQDNLMLVHLGKNSDHWSKIKARCRNPEKILELFDLTSEQVNMLYKAVDCVLFPSWYEGFGLPPLEAMAAGTPAVTSRSASLPEAVGFCSLSAEPGDVDGLADQVSKLLNDPDQRALIVKDGLKHAAQFSWQACVRKTAQVYDGVINAL